MGTTSLGVAITPDGKRIVYGATVDGRRQLVVRAMDELEATPLTTLGADARQPFISPDGALVGYFEGSALRKVSIEGGPPVTICPIPSQPIGASWADDGTIVFASSSPMSPASGLWSVSSGGGEPIELTRPSPGEGRYVQPDVLPGAEAVLYTMARRGSPDLDNGDIAVFSLSTGESKALVNGGSSPHYVPTGHIVYAVAGSLRAVGFDPDTLEVTSDPVPVLANVATGDISAMFDVARDGSLVYLQGSDSNVSELVWIDRQGREERLTAPPRNYRYPRLSPDGARVAVDIREQEDDIWIWDFARETLTRLTFDPAIDRYPTWTPDGLRVTFGSGSPSHPFWKAAAGTGNVERLAEISSVFPQTFSPDGKHLMLRAIVPDRANDVVMLTLEDGAVVPLVTTEFDEVNAEVSPDGLFLAYQSNKSGQYEIYVRPFPNVEDGLFQVSTDGGTRPLWARNGRELFYMNSERQIMGVQVRTESGIAFGNPEVVVERPYFAGGGLGRTYDVAPDGKRFLMLKAQGTSERELIFVQNWSEELKRLVPTGGGR